MAGPALAHVKGVRLSLGAAPLFDDVEFVLHKGERACLVGANGAGKSTLMRMLAGSVEPDDGEIAFTSGTHVAFVPQDPDLAGYATLRDYAMSLSVSRGTAFETPAHAAEAELEALGLDPERAPTRLSGGETRRAALARAFAADPDLLLLDEPTNHLDIAAIEALEARIASFRGAALIISHDRRFLENASTATLWLRQRRIIKSERGFGAFEEWAERVETEEQRALARLETHLKAEEHWLQRGVTARRSRNEGRRRKLMAMRAERRAQKTALSAPQAALQAERGAESSKLVIEAKKLNKGFGERTLIKDLSLRVLRGDRVGIVGPNGVGKTTLLELLLKRSEPDSGETRLGLNLEIAYVDQTRAALDNERTLWDTLTPLGGDQVMVRGRPRHVAAYAKDFLFGPDQLRQPLGALSGGERNRVALALALAKPANLLVLDEPTNDLDMDTLDALEDMLAAYDGTILIVSHDRAFLDGVATQILGPLGNGRWVETPGGWSDFEREFPNAITPAQARPKREASDRASPDAPAGPKARAPTKLSYKDERRANEIDALLPKLSAEIDSIETQFAEANAFGGDQAALQRAAARLEQLREDKDAAEIEWLEIEERREALAKQ